ncbi:MAG: ATP-binding protein [Nitrospirota bacterium]
MLKTLYSRLATTLFGLLCIVGVLYVLLTLFTTQTYLQEVSQKLNLTLAEHLASEKILIQEGQVNQEATKEIFHMLMVINPSIEIYLLDPQGKILTYSAPPGKVKRDAVSLSPVFSFLDKLSPPSFPLLGDDPKALDHQKIFTVAPIVGKNKTEGYLYVVLGGEEYDTVANLLQESYILRLSAVTAVGILLLTFLAGLLFFNLLTRRLRNLATALDRFTQSDFSTPLTPLKKKSDLAGDEIDRLSTTFYKMAHRILEQIEALKETDRFRREWIANISHDLRTPLASLQGYLETLLLKEGKLSPAEQKQYLEIALQHSDRLGKLVLQLFELTKLDSKEVQLNWEQFSIGELTQDIVQKFQLTAENKKIRFKTSDGETLPFVFGDIGMIERVLENLIENGLRHTPEGGRITITLCPDTEKVKVEVADTGCGIPSDALPYIFDRFYRVDKNRSCRSSGDSLGLGLGLAIAKRILELHESPINVHSTLNIGTTFIFHLPISRV